jgi:hypothetical protein
MSRAVVLSIILIGLVSGCGTVERRIVATSDPPGALVFANDEEIGRTPFTRDFTWYGVYDVQVRKEGYDTKIAKTKVIAPLWQWPPFDLMAELLPFHWKDYHRVNYRLTPTTQQAADPELMLARAEQLRVRLRSSQFTRNPGATTVPTQPTTTTAPSTTTAPTTDASTTEPSTTQSTTAPTTQPTTTRAAPTTQPSTTPATAPTTRHGSFL